MERITAGNQTTFRLEAKKDGVAWNLSNGSVRLLLYRPDRLVIARSAMAVDAPGGVFECVVSGVDLPTTQVGRWFRRWEITDGGAVYQIPEVPIGFELLERWTPQ